MIHPRLSPLLHSYILGRPVASVAVRPRLLKGSKGGVEKAMSMQMTAGRRGKPNVEFGLIYAICFGLFLIAAVVQKILPWRWFGHRKDALHKSIFAQARNAASICATYAFMV